jgi:hypothetical protein
LRLSSFVSWRFWPLLANLKTYKIGSISPLLGYIAIASFLIIGYMIRSVMLTGWIFYPTPLGQLPVSWAMPKGVRYHPSNLSYVPTSETVYGNIDVISAWAKLPGPQFTKAITDGFSAWWPQWWQGFSSSIHFELIKLSLIAFVIRLALINKNGYLRDIVFVLAFGYLPLAYWFFSAPDPRFAAFNFWICLAVSAAVCLRHFSLSSQAYKDENSADTPKWRSFFSKHAISKPASTEIKLFIPGLILIAASVSYVGLHYNQFFKFHGQPNLIETGRVAQLPVRKVQLDSGSTVYVPEGSGEDRCGVARRPCTPYIKQDLRIEKDDDRFLKFSLP